MKIIHQKIVTKTVDNYFWQVGVYQNTLLQFISFVMKKFHLRQNICQYFLQLVNNKEIITAIFWNKFTNCLQYFYYRN